MGIRGRLKFGAHSRSTHPIFSEQSFRTRQFVRRYPRGQCNRIELFR